jgi:hypothetical protein
VRKGAETGAYTTLTPRQALTAVPNALYASSAPWNLRLPVPAANQIVSTGISASNLDMTIGSDGLPVIAVRSTEGLLVIHCQDVACTQYSTQTIVSNATVIQQPSITIGSDGFPWISFLDDTNDALKIAHCADLGCTSASVSFTTLAVGVFGDYSSIAVGADGYIMVSYATIDNYYYYLKYAHCLDASCWSVNINDVEGHIGSAHISLALGADGLPLIAYAGSGPGQLKTAHCNDLDCASKTLATPNAAGSAGSYASLAIGQDGLGLVSYWVNAFDTKQLGVAHCDNLTCTTATVSVLDTTGDPGIYTSLTIGADGLGIISYETSADPRQLRIAHCQDIACTTASIQVIETSNSLPDTAITIGQDGLPLVAYPQSSILKVLHCANEFCTPYFRRR